MMLKATEKTKPLGGRTKGAWAAPTTVAAQAARTMGAAAVVGPAKAQVAVAEPWADRVAPRKPGLGAL